MKTVGIVLLSLLGAIVLLLLLVLLVPVGVKVAYKEKTFSLRIKFLFLRFTILPRKKKEKKKRLKKEKKKAKSKKKEKKAQNKEQKKKKSGLSLKTVKALLVKHLPPILSCFYIRTLRLDWHVHADDAGDTAIRYGAASSAVAGILSILDRFAKRLKHAEVDIIPDYDAGSVEGDVSVFITVWKLVFSLIRLLLDLIQYKVL